MTFRTSAFTVASAIALALAGCNDPPAAETKGPENEPTGSLRAALTLPDNSEILSVHYELTGAAVPLLPADASGDVPVHNSVSILTFRLGGLQQGMGHIELSADTEYGETCSGGADYVISTNDVTAVTVNITCTATDVLGDLVVNGSIISCPVIESIMAIPGATRIGTTVDLTSVISHGIGSNDVRWTCPGGVCATPTDYATTYECVIAGPNTLTVEIDDADLPTCHDVATVEIICELAPGCGNGAPNAGEVCDDGNMTNGDGCDDGAGGNCTATACGNGVLTSPEACDDGNAVEGDGCDNNCTVTACGNGVRTGSEACDDGNTVNGDGCDNTCTLSGCGNGTVGGTEVCDDGNTTNGDGCDNNCTTSACGNGIPAGTEQCDDGNMTNGDGCDANCTLSGCGNGTVGGTEACDDGNMTNGDGCDNNCTMTGCGNGIVTGTEACDDGNTNNSDSCSNTCTVNDQCTPCRQANCTAYQGFADVFNGCLNLGPTGDAARAAVAGRTFDVQNCLDLTACAQANDCAYNDGSNGFAAFLGRCYCGDRSTDDCVAMGPDTVAPGNALCLVEAQDAAESTDNATVLERLSQFDYAIGWAFWLSRCDTESCDDTPAGDCTPN